VQSRIPGKKTYQNWRDMGPHHFSFFSLGTSAVRDGNRLLLSTRYLQEGKPEPAKVVAVPAPKVATRAKRKSQLRGLRIPEPNATDELEAPPTTAASNAGTDAEILVGKLLQAAGWAIVYYAGKRGYGFDIWARKGKAAILIEVKSSLGQLGAVTLTRLEYEAAQHHGRNFVLALVENVRENPKVRFVTDPVSRLSIEAKATEAYVIAREAWYPVAEQSWK
jgi:Holliday junction resolvase